MAKDQALAVGFLNSSKGKPKPKNSKLPKKKKLEKPKSSDGCLNPSKEKDKKGKEKAKCTYSQKRWNPESSCMKNTIDTMAELLEKNNIPVLTAQGRRMATPVQMRARRNVMLWWQELLNLHPLSLIWGLPGIW